MADDVREAYRRGLDVREYRRMRDEGTLPTNERADLQEAYRLNIPVEELRARRAAAARTSTRVPPAVQRGAAMSDMQMADVPGNIPSGPSAASVRRARDDLMRYNAMQEADMPGNIPPVSQADIQRAREGIMRAEDMQNADMPGNIPAPGTSFAPDEIQEAMSRTRMERQRQRNRPNTRMTATPSPADALNQRELDRIALGNQLGDIMKGGDIQPPAERSFLERLGLRRTNETGEGRPSTGNFREDLRQLGKSLGFKKGGKVKKMAKGGAVKAPSASRRGDGCASRGKTKGRMV
jgi:hypothetical protein